MVECVLEFLHTYKYALAAPLLVMTSGFDSLSRNALEMTAELYTAVVDVTCSSLTFQYSRL